MVDKDKLPQKWINTPFAFTRLSKNLSLLQQAVLVKVSEQIQPFLKEFFGTYKLAHSTKWPKALFSEAAKKSGVTQIYISYAELGVPENNYFAVKQVMREVLEVKVEGPKKNKDGSWGMRMYNVFKSGETSVKNTGVVFSLNPEVIDPDQPLYVLDYAFNMAEGYVSHPDNIALIGEVSRMPMIYYILRDKCNNNWKNKKKIDLKVSELKKYLGMLEFSKNEEVKEAYPKFSQFRKHVLDKSLADINRLKKLGLLDVCVSYEPVYNSKRKVGNPAFIRFYIYDTIEEMETIQKKQHPEMLFTDDKPGEREWRMLVDMYKGKLREYMKPLKVYSFDGEELTVMATDKQVEEFEKHITPEERNMFRDCMVKIFGKVVRFGYNIVKR